MAHYFLYSEKDSTIYENVPTENAGIDEILEVEKGFENGLPYNSRILIKFSDDSLDEIAGMIASGTIASGAQFYLNLYTAEAYEIPLEYILMVHPIAQSWEMGTGRRNNEPITTTGVSWNYRDGDAAWTTTGSTYLSSSLATQSFSYDSTDLSVNITNIVQDWINDTIENHGLVIKRQDVEEDDTMTYGVIRFFSNETSTIYRPRLEIVWEEAVFAPPTESAISSSFIIATSSYDNTEITGWATSSYYTGGLGSEWILVSGTTDTYQAYPTATVADVFEYNPTYSLYVSESYSYSGGNVYWSGSNYIIINQTASLESFYTGALGSDYYESQSYLWISESNIYSYFVRNEYSVYVSESYIAGSGSFTYVSESITGSTSESIITYLNEEITSTDSTIYFYDIKDVYQKDSKVLFRLFARDLYPEKIYKTGSWFYEQNKYLPSSSYYSIKDAYTGWELIPFSNASKISCDSTGSYFYLWLNGFEPERFYKIMLRVDLNGEERIFDNDYIIKIIR